VAELVDALDLGSSGVTRGGSSPPFRTGRRPRRPRAVKPCATGESDFCAYQIVRGVVRRMAPCLPFCFQTEIINSQLERERHIWKWKP
jgi:hypothetical protein